MFYRLMLKLGLIDRTEWYRRQGATIGTGCHIMDEVRIDPGHERYITIGNNVTIAPRAFLLAHDASTKSRLGHTRQAMVTIEDGAFIGAGAIILPGVTIGQGAIVGAGSVVSRDVRAYVTVCGNPAREINMEVHHVQN